MEAVTITVSSIGKLKYIAKTMLQAARLQSLSAGNRAVVVVYFIFPIYPTVLKMYLTMALARHSKLSVSSGPLPLDQELARSCYFYYRRTIAATLLIISLPATFSPVGRVQQWRLSCSSKVKKLHTCLTALSASGSLQCH